MKKYISIFILICVFSVKAFPPVTHGLVHSTTSAQTLSANIISKMFHWQSAKDMPALSDGTAIDSIQDLSGHGNTISNTGTSRPQYYATKCNGLPAWYFDGTNDVFNIPPYTTRGAIMVVNVDSTRTSFALLEGFYGSRSTSSPNSYWGTDGGTSIFDFSPSGNPFWINSYFGASRNFFLPNGKTFKVIAMNTSAGVTDATGFQFGSDRKFGTRFLKGYISEVMGFSTMPTNKEIDTITSYLWSKYNMTTPYNFVQDGNSIGVYCGSYVRDSLGISRMTNVSVGGQTTVDRYNAAPTSVDTCIRFPFTKNIVYLLEGTNDLLTFGADSCYAHMMAYATARQVAGWKVAISTVLSRTPSGARAGYETSRDSLNTLLNNTTQTSSFKIVNFGQDSNLSDPNAYSNTTYFSDGIHPTATGYKLIAKYVANVIKSFTW